jgi:hypothetical protein
MRMADGLGEHDGTQGRTRKLRFAMAATTSLFTAGVLMVLTATTAFPVSFNLSGLPFKVSADRLDSEGFLQIPRLESTPGGQLPVGLTTSVSAQLWGLCESVVLPTPAGPATLRITAGDHAPVTIKNLSLNLTDLMGETTFQGLQLGQRPPGDDTPGTLGGFGQSATAVSIDKLRLTTSTLAVGTISMTDMHFSVGYGDRECF